MYGDEIKAHRIGYKLTQMELSNKTKIPQQTISWMEKNKGVPKIDILVQLADFYKISLDELIGRTTIEEGEKY